MTDVAQRALPNETNGTPPFDAVAWQRKAHTEVARLWEFSATPITVTGTNTLIGTSVTTSVIAMPVAPIFGTSHWVIPVNDNTGGVVATVDGHGPYAVLREDGATSLQFGDLRAGSLYKWVFDGTAYRRFAATAAVDQVASVAPDCIFREEQPTSTDAGTFTSGAFRTRLLNTSARNVLGGGAVLAANQVTLQAGTYFAEWRAPGYKCASHISRLQNITDATTIETGSSERSDAGDNSTTHSFGRAVFTLSTAKVIELQHRCGTTEATDGFGRAVGTGAKEVYSSLAIWRVGSLAAQTDGIPGGAVTIKYQFSTTTTDADPGSGKLRLNNATQALATQAFVDLLSTELSDYTAVLDALITASITEGYARLVKFDDPTRWLLFRVNAVTTASGYRKLVLAESIASGPTTSPFSNNDILLLEWSPRGDKGDTGGAGPAGSIGTLTAASIGFNLVNGTVVETRAANATTYAVKTQAGADPSGGDPVYAVFRDTAAGTGGFSLLTITAALSVTISAGSTLGNGTANTPFKNWLVLFLDTGNTPRLGVINCRSTPIIYPLGQLPIASSTAEGGAGAADSALTFYTGTAVANKPYTILASLFYESGLATAGNWNVAPDKIRLFGRGDPLPGTVLQQAGSFTGAVATGTTTVPADDTIPQSNEGDQYLSQAITPTSAAHLLEVDVSGNFANTTSGQGVMSLFQDAGTDSLASNPQQIGAANQHTSFWILWIQRAGVSVSTTFKMRFGMNNAGTNTFNGVSSARKYGGVINSFLRVKEIVT